MSYIDNVNIKGQEYEIHDTDAREDITDLSNQLKNTKEFFVDMLLTEKTVGPDDMVSITDAAPLSAEGLVVDVEPVQAGSGDPSPENIRPITGWDGVTVKDEGLNLAEFVQDKGIDMSGNVVDHNGRIATVTPIKIESGVAYKFIVFGDENTMGIIAVYNGTTLVRRTANILPNATLNTSGGDTFYFCCYDINTTIETAKAMIVRSTDAPVAYEPYKSRTASASFPETIYGGTVDLATGEGEIDRAMVTLTGLTTQTLQYSTATKTFYITGIVAPGMKFKSYNEAFVGISDKFESYPGTPNWPNVIKPYIGYGSQENFRFSLPGYTNPADVLPIINGTQVVYELANPIPLTLTPAELELFKGINNISADAGKVTVTYWEQKELQTIIKETFQVTGEKLVI